MRLLWPWHFSKLNRGELAPHLLTGASSAWIALFWGALFKLANLLVWYGPLYPRVEALARQQGWFLQLRAFGVLWAMGLTSLVLLLPIGWWLKFSLKHAGGRLTEAPAPLRVPAGAWLAIAAGYCVMLWMLGIVAVMEAQPWSTALAAWGRAHLFTVIPIVGTVMTVKYLASLSGLSRGRAYWKYTGLAYAPIIALLALLTVLFTTVVLAEHTGRLATQTWVAHPQGKSQLVACSNRGPMRMPTRPSYFLGIAVRAATPAEAADAIHRGEYTVNGLLDSRYARSPRVILRPLRQPSREVMAVVPAGMAMPAPGERVRIATGYAEPGVPCRYLPNFVANVFPG